MFCKQEKPFVGPTKNESTANHQDYFLFAKPIRNRLIFNALFPLNPNV